MGSTRTWELHDALGSVRATLDDAGTPVGASGYSYTPYGLVQSGAEPQPFGFTGELQDATTGLVYLRARWYDPNSGTFTSKHPFAGWTAQPYSLHPYQYAYSNPVRYRDPTGEEGWEGPPWLDALAQCTGPGPQPPMCAWNPWGREPFHEALNEGGNQALDAGQDAIDAVGTLPGAGEPADAVNAGISLARGDTRRALLSCAAMIPFVGWGATAMRHSRLGGYVLDNNILIGIHRAHRGLINTGVDHIDNAPLTFAQRRNGLLYYTPTAREEFLRGKGVTQADFDELVHTYNLQTLPEPDSLEVLDTMRALGITSRSRYNDISYLVAARNNGFGLVTGDRGLLSAALRDGYWDVEFRFFTPRDKDTVNDVIRVYDEAHRTIQQNAPRVDPYKITGGR